MKGIQRETHFAAFVNEYLARKRLAKLGYRSDINELDDFKGEIFVKISILFDQLEKEKMEKDRKRQKHGRK